VAERVNRSVSAVERKLALIRKAWTDDPEMCD
jgi:hypothetical protein